MSRRDFASLPAHKQRKIQAIREYHAAKERTGKEPFPKGSPSTRHTQQALKPTPTDVAAADAAAAAATATEPR